MKIAIQANPNRGKEIISLLENLGRTKTSLSGNGQNYTYYIDANNVIRYGDAPKDYKVYTLEEFEKKFPFKIGDLCIYQSEYAGDIVVKVLRMIIQDNDIVYEIGHKDTDKTYSGIYRRREILRPYKEMKEERNVTLTLDKAKEWYKKGEELREIALQAFTEKELYPLPRSWDEYCRKYKFVCLSTRHANISLKYDALIKLEQLRNCWWNGWEPEWNNCEKYVIKWDKNDLIVFTAKNIHAFLVFPTREMAVEFLKCFRSLIEQAGDLI